MKIKVLGPGCANCKTLERRTQEAISELNIAAELEKVQDVPGMMAYGIMTTPALVIDEKLVSQGRVLSVEAIKGFILQGRQ